MNSPLLQSIRSHSFMLASFAIATALILAWVNISTAERIIQQKQAAERKALYEVLPSSTHDNDLLNDTFTLKPSDPNFTQIELLGLTENRSVYIARFNNQVSGIILPFEAHDGYSGDIVLLAGINADGSINGVRVISHRETPGLGDKIDLRVSDWILGFNNHSLANPSTAEWKVQKDGGHFDQFVGATITPRAIVKALKQALLFFEVNQQQLLSL